jgi:hypothetical protein
MGDMKRRIVRVVSSISLLTVLTACSYEEPESGSFSFSKKTAAEVTYISGTDSIWSIAVGFRHGNDEQCLNDPMVSEAFATADLPSSQLGINLKDDAAQADAQRIAECLSDAYTDTEIVVTSPAGIATE